MENMRQLRVTKGKNTFSSPKIFPLQSVQYLDLMTTDVPRSLIWICVIE